MSRAPRAQATAGGKASQHPEGSPSPEARHHAPEPRRLTDSTAHQVELLSPLLTYQDASKFLGIPLSSMYALVSLRRIPHYRLSGRMVRFNLADLQSWVEERRVDVTRRATR